MELDIKKVRRGRLTDTVRQELMQLIMSQSLTGGEELPSEAELAEKFGVGKQVIREALRGLAAMGVLKIHHGKRAVINQLSSEPLRSYFKFAAHVTEEGLQEAIEFRRTLEAGTVSLAAVRISDEEITKLEKILNRMERVLNTVDPCIECDVEFHLQIARSSGNRLMFVFIDALSELFRESMKLLKLQYSLRDERAMYNRHVKILEALKDRNPDDAIEAMKVHFNATEPVILSIMKNKKA